MQEAIRTMILAFEAERPELSRRGLAEALGIDGNTLKRILNGTSNCKPKTLRTVASHLNGEIGEEE